MSAKIRIDVVSDVACPWCYVGKKHLEKALEDFNETEVEVAWHPFQLDPTVPREGKDKDQHYAEKFGSMERFYQLSERLELAGQQAGINFDFHALQRVPNTLRLHVLLHEAGKEGFAPDLKEAFLSAYFEKGLDLSSDEVVLEIMSGFGWSPEKTREIWNDQEKEYWVLQEIRHYQNLGVNAVPFFIINNTYALSGAQPTDVFKQALIQIGNEMDKKQGEACEINDPNC